MSNLRSRPQSTTVDNASGSRAFRGTPNVRLLALIAPGESNLRRTDVAFSCRAARVPGLELDVTAGFPSGFVR